MNHPIFMDNNSTTKTDARVYEAMQPYFMDEYGNPSSNHYYGWKASMAIDQAREVIASFLGCHEDQVVFTSGGTEANNLVIKSLQQKAERSTNEKFNAISSNIEHKSISESLNSNMESLEIRELKANHDGIVDIGLLDALVDKRTIFASVMMANNEIGTIQPISYLAEYFRDRGVLFHTDAVQALGKTKLNFNEINCDFISLSAHKIYGPKGIGLIVARNKDCLAKAPLVSGGGQEFGVRSGTQNVPGIIGFAKAIEILSDQQKRELEHLRHLTDLFLDGLKEKGIKITLNGDRQKRIPGNLNFVIKGIDASKALNATKSQIAISTGSACTSANQEPSHVLKAIGLSDEDALSSFRIGFGRFNTAKEVVFAVNVFSEIVKKHIKE